jgi:hypothetical protein
MVFVHLPAAAWGAAMEIFGWDCPLTPLENHFRSLLAEVHTVETLSRGT